MKTKIEGLIRSEGLTAKADRDTLWLAVIHAVTSIRENLLAVIHAKTLEAAHDAANRALEQLDILESERTEIAMDEPTDADEDR